MRREASCKDSLAGGCYRGWLGKFAFTGHRGNDLAAVKTTVLDEDVGCFQPADDHSGDIDARNVGFKTVGVGLWAAGLGIQANSLLLQKIEVGMVAGHCKNLGGSQALLGSRVLDPNLARFNACDAG